MLFFQQETAFHMCSRQLFSQNVTVTVHNSFNKSVLRYYIDIIYSIYRRSALLSIYKVLLYKLRHVYMRMSNEANPYIKSVVPDDLNLYQKEVIC